MARPRLSMPDRAAGDGAKVDRLHQDRLSPSIHRSRPHNRGNLSDPERFRASPSDPLTKSGGSSAEKSPRGK
jgi:hypothetical protein